MIRYMCTCAYTGTKKSDLKPKKFNVEIKLENDICIIYADEIGNIRKFILESICKGNVTEFSQHEWHITDNLTGVSFNL